MSTHATLNAEKRDEQGKGAARKLRAVGRIPAVMYGSDKESVMISVDAREAEHVFQGISVENTIVDVKIKGQRAPVSTLVREVQVHPWRPRLLHIDFLRIDKNVAVEVEIPIHLEGVPEGVKTHGGVLEHIVHDLAVRCLPEDMPQAISVDVSALEIGDAIHVSDIAVPEGIEILLEGDRTVCTVVTPRAVATEDEEGDAEALVAEGEDAEDETGEGASEEAGAEEEG